MSGHQEARHGWENCGSYRNETDTVPIDLKGEQREVEAARWGRAPGADGKVVWRHATSGALPAECSGGPTQTRATAQERGMSATQVLVNLSVICRRGGCFWAAGRPAGAPVRIWVVGGAGDLRRTGATVVHSPASVGGGVKRGYRQRLTRGELEGQERSLDLA